MNGSLPCPVCDSVLLTNVDSGDLSTLPKFCSECGTKLVRNCPKCHHAFDRLAKYCSECGESAYGTAPSSNKTVAGPSQTDQLDAKHLLSRCREVIPVNRRAIREMILVAVRLNPAHCAAHTLYESIGSITETMSRPEIASIVGSALEEADLSNARADLASSHDAIWQMVNGMISEMEMPLKREFPSYPEYISGHEWLDAPHKTGEAFADRMYRQVTKHAHELETIEKHYTQLVEFFPRYNEIMNRSGFWSGVIGFAASFFGGGLGAVGAETWNNWQ